MLSEYLLSMESSLFYASVFDNISAASSMCFFFF